MTKEKQREIHKDYKKKMIEILNALEEEFYKYLKKRIPSLQQKNYEEIWNEIEKYIIEEIYIFLKQCYLNTLKSMENNYNLDLDMLVKANITDQDIDQNTYNIDGKNISDRIKAWIEKTQEKQKRNKISQENTIEDFLVQYFLLHLDKLALNEMEIIWNSVSKKTLRFYAEEDIIIIEIEGPNLCGNCPIGTYLYDEAPISPPYHPDCYCEQFIYFKEDIIVSDDIEEIEELDLEVIDIDYI